MTVWLAFSVSVRTPTTSPCRPAGDAWHELWHDLWWSRARGLTGQNGEFSTRVFHGRHAVTVALGGRERVFPVSLDTSGANLVLVWDGTTLSPLAP